jgi:hypothetical protein
MENGGVGMSDKVFSVKTVVVILGSVAVLTSGFFLLAPASANVPDARRISEFRNSLGSVTAYCIDANGDPASSYADGGILVLDARGRRVLFASDEQIQAASQTITQNTPITSGSVYTLYRQPGGDFELDSEPDVEGRTYLGSWTADCQPTAP